MRGWLANKIEDLLDKIGWHSLATRWYNFVSQHQWHQPHYRY